MKPSYVIPILLLVVCCHLTSVGQGPSSQWGNCGFTTLSEMNAFDPSSDEWACKRVFVTATNEHYRWDGNEWQKESEPWLKVSDGGLATEVAEEMYHSGNVVIGTSSNPNDRKLFLSGSSELIGEFYNYGNSAAADSYIFFGQENGNKYIQWNKSSDNARIEYDANNDLLNIKNGDLALDGNIVLSSDLRLKKDIQPLSSALTKILSIRGMLYTWDPDNPLQREFSTNKQIGVIAQEVESHMPELVIEDEHGYKSVNYIGLIPYLIESIRTQQEQIDSLEKALLSQTQMLNKIAEMNQELESLKNELQKKSDTE